MPTTCSIIDVPLLPEKPYLPHGPCELRVSWGGQNWDGVYEARFDGAADRPARIRAESPDAVVEIIREQMRANAAVGETPWRIEDRL